MRLQRRLLPLISGPIAFSLLFTSQPAPLARAATPTLTPTTATVTATATAAPSSTPAPGTATPTPTSSGTPAATIVAPVAAGTHGTPTPTGTATVSATATQTPTSTPSATPCPTGTATAVRGPAATAASACGARLRPLFSPGTGSPYSRAVLGTSGLQDYYRLDQSGGSVAYDSKGSRDGSINGGVTLGVAGAIANDPDTAMAFDGSTGYVAVPNASAAIDGGAISLEAWAKLPSNPSANQAIVSIRNDASADFYILQKQGGSSLEARFRNSGGTASTLNASASPGVWHYFALVYNGSSNLTLYIDGVAAASTAAAGTIADASQDLRIRTRYGQLLAGRQRG